MIYQLRYSVNLANVQGMDSPMSQMRHPNGVDGISPTVKQMPPYDGICRCLLVWRGKHTCVKMSQTGAHAVLHLKHPIGPIKGRNVGIKARRGKACSNGAKLDHSTAIGVILAQSISLENQ